MIKTIFDIPDDHRIILEDASEEDSRGIVSFFENGRKYTLRSKPPPERPDLKGYSQSLLRNNRYTDNQHAPWFACFPPSTRLRRALPSVGGFSASATGEAGVPLLGSQRERMS
mmetsp:Transcript_5628/g.15753  ORF Transcript_5628/g.15753 Transcript_5628/m.15753 type:complete len:113 (+) Transcript_5628:1356-1694(+)